MFISNKYNPNTYSKWKKDRWKNETGRTGQKESYLNRKKAVDNIYNEYMAQIEGKNKKV
jgi:hypothetical protein